MMGRTLEMRLKFDIGLSRGLTHAVILEKDGKQRAALAHVPVRGYPRLTVKNSKVITRYKVKGDLLDEEWVTATEAAGARFDCLAENPVIVIPV